MLHFQRIRVRVPLPGTYDQGTNNAISGKLDSRFFNIEITPLKTRAVFYNAYMDTPHSDSGTLQY